MERSRAQTLALLAIAFYTVRGMFSMSKPSRGTEVIKNVIEMLYLKVIRTIKCDDPVAELLAVLATPGTQSLLQGLLGARDESAHRAPRIPLLTLQTGNPLLKSPPVAVQEAIDATVSTTLCCILERFNEPS